MSETQQPIDFVEQDLYPEVSEQSDSLYLALEGISFPISREALIAEAGERQIFSGKECNLTLGDLLGRMSQREFGSVSDLNAAISKVSLPRPENQADAIRASDLNV